MLVILVLWLILKNYLARRRQTPYQRGIYENLFRDLANSYPDLWSRNGPRQDVVPSRLISRWKWHLINYWSKPGKPSGKPPEDDDDIDDVLGSFSRVKRYWMRKWSGEIESTMNPSEGDTANLMERGSISQDTSTDDMTKTTGNVTELVAPPAPLAATNAIATATLSEPATHAVVNQWRQSLLRDEARRPSNQSSSANRNSGVLVEEKEMGWLRQGFEKTGAALSSWRPRASGGEGREEKSPRRSDDGGGRDRSARSREEAVLALSC